MMNPAAKHRHRAAADVTLDELTALCEIMASLCRAGVPLDRGLLQLAHELPGRLGLQAEEIGEQLRQGSELADVVSREGGVFPPVYASVVEAGLRSGRTTAALEGFARLARQLAELRALVLSALVYPMVLLVVLVVVSVTVLPQLPPAFKAFLDDYFLGTASHRDYAVLMAAYQVVAQWFWLLPIALLGVAIFWIVATRSANAAQGDRRDWLAGVPGASRMLRNSRLLAFTHVLQLLLEQRVPLHDAVRLAGCASGDRDLRTDACQLAAGLERGERGSDLGKSAKRRGIPSLLRWGLCNDQQMGKLAATLERAQRLYRYRTEDSVTWLRTFLPVYFSVALGGLVGLVYAALFLLPWFKLLRLIAEPLRLP